jgi:hypothetical protein
MPVEGGCLHLTTVDLARSAGGNPVSLRDRLENGPSNGARDKDPL